jgi:hypothetical protein
MTTGVQTAETCLRESSSSMSLCVMASTGMCMVIVQTDVLLWCKTLGLILLVCMSTRLNGSETGLETIPMRTHIHMHTALLRSTMTLTYASRRPKRDVTTLTFPIQPWQQRHRRPDTRTSLLRAMIPMLVGRMYPINSSSAAAIRGTLRRTVL